MNLTLVFLFSLILRIIVIFLSNNTLNYDLQSYLLIGEKIKQGVNIYPVIAKLHYPYFPLFLYFQWLAISLKNILPPIIFFKVIINLFDLGNGFLIYLLTKKKISPVVIYLLNPVTILIFCFHGQFDSLPIFFLLLTIYFLNKRSKENLAAVFYGLSITLKHWTVFLFFLVIRRAKNKIRFFLITFIILFLSIVLYSFIIKISFIKVALSIIYTLITYRSLFSHWGFGQILKNLFFPLANQPPIFFQKIFLRLFLSVFFIYSLKLKEKDLLKSITKLFLFFYTFTVGFSIQYLSWIVPFLVLSRSKKILPIIFFSTFYLLSNYLSWKSSFNFLSRWISPLGITLWAIFLISWYSEEKSFSKTPNS